MQVAVLTSRVNWSVRPSVRSFVCLSVCLSVSHTLILCQNDSSYDHVVFTDFSFFVVYFIVKDTIKWRLLLHIWLLGSTCAVSSYHIYSLCNASWQRFR